MSTDDSQPTPVGSTSTQPAPGEPGAPFATPGAPSAGTQAPGAPTPGTAPTGSWPTEPGAGEPGSTEPREAGWFDRNAPSIIAVSVAVIAVAAALVALFFYRESIENDNDDTADAVSDFIEGQGQDVETVECDGGHCAVIVDGAAYSVLVQEDEDGDQHFGVSAYAGD